MRKFYHEFEKTFDGRASHIRGIEFFRMGERRIGLFVYELFDKNKTIRRHELIVRV